MTTRRQAALGRCAAIALAAAILGGAGGTVLLAVAYLASLSPGSFEVHAGNVLLLSAIPLLFVAGCLMDGADRARESDDEREPDGCRVVRLRDWRPIAALAFAAALYAAAAPAHAQQTLFNVPSTDVLDKGKVYGELDVSWKPVDPKFSSFVPRVVVGTGGRVEVGLNVLGNIQPGPDATTLSPVIKWKAYDGGDNGWAVVVGDHLFVPVHNRGYDAGNYVYAEVSKTWKQSGTRLTGGGYHFSENVVSPAQRAGGQFGVEQPINKYLGFQADWFTGKHASGYFTPGFVVKPHPKVAIYAGYSIGNTGVSEGNHFFLTEVGFYFN